MTNEQLNALNKKDLLEKARRIGVANPAGLRKDDLIKAILKLEKQQEKARAKGGASSANQSPPPERKSTSKTSRSSASKAEPVIPLTEKAIDKPLEKPADKTAAKGEKASKNGKATAPVSNDKAAPRPKTTRSAGKTETPPASGGNGKSPSKNGSHKPVRGVARNADDLDGDDELDGKPHKDGGAGANGTHAKSPKDLPSGYQKDRVVVAVIDPFWLHCYWELTQQSVQRAEAAMGPDWHSCKPILRLLDVSAQDTTSTAESIVKDIDLHSGATNWYIQVNQPPRSYRVDIGYLSRRGNFFQISRSDIITTPKAGVSEPVEGAGAWSMEEKQAERILAMSTGFEQNGTGSSLELKRFFEERFRRPLGSTPISATSGTLFSSGKDRKFFFEIKAELTIYGRTEAGSRVTLQGEPMLLDNQGRFAMRYSLPDGRQIIPAVAASADGVEERTIVLAIERNTKQLEPMIHDAMNDHG